MYMYIYIYYHKYQVKLHSSPWFSAACTAAIDHGNHFCLYLKNKSAEFQVRFRQVSNHYKRVFEAAKLAYKLIKQESIPSLKLVLQLFAGLLIVNLALLYLLLFSGLELFIAVSDKAKLLPKNFPRNSNVRAVVSLVSLLELI